MNKIRFLRVLLLVLLSGLLVSCGSISTAKKGARFHDGASANVVVRFYDWNSIHIVRPDIREGGYLPLLDRDGVARTLDHVKVGQDLAVIVLGYMFSNAQEAEMIGYWNTLLRERGFRRVVVVRAGFKDEIDGLLIVHDSAMTAAHDQSGKVTATFAALPAPVGTDVAHPSGGPVR